MKDDTLREVGGALRVMKLGPLASDLKPEVGTWDSSYAHRHTRSLKWPSKPGKSLLVAAAPPAGPTGGGAALRQAGLRRQADQQAYRYLLICRNARHAPPAVPCLGQRRLPPRLGVCSFSMRQALAAAPCALLAYHPASSTTGSPNAMGGRWQLCKWYGAM